jgi:signal transduction histidine kinase
LTNAYRHGRAARVEVELSLLPGNRLQLRVSDDGVGFLSESFTVGLGVASVAARVEGKGGAWWISSTPGEGTVFSAVVPMGRKALGNLGAAVAAVPEEPRSVSRWPYPPAVA